MEQPSRGNNLLAGQYFIFSLLTPGSPSHPHTDYSLSRVWGMKFSTQNYAVQVNSHESYEGTLMLCLKNN